MTSEDCIVISYHCCCCQQSNILVTILLNSHATQQKAEERASSVLQCDAAKPCTLSNPAISPTISCINPFQQNRTAPQPGDTAQGCTFINANNLQHNTIPYRRLTSPSSVQHLATPYTAPPSVHNLLVCSMARRVSSYPTPCRYDEVHAILLSCAFVHVTCGCACHVLFLHWCVALCQVCVALCQVCVALCQVCISWHMCIFFPTPFPQHLFPNPYTPRHCSGHT